MNELTGALVVALTILIQTVNALLTQRVRRQVKSPNGETTAEMVHGSRVDLTEIRRDLAAMRMAAQKMEARQSRMESRLTSIEAASK